MSLDQSEFRKDEMINEEYKDNNNPNPTLAGAHAHLTTHIQNNQGRDWLNKSRLDVDCCYPTKRVLS